MGPGHRRGAAHPDRPRRLRCAAVAVSADGRRAVSGGGDGTVRVWDLDTGHAAAHPDRPRRLGDARWRSARTAAAPSPAALTGRCGCGTWTPGAPLHTLTGHDGAVRAVAVSADGRRAVSGGGDGTVRVWDLDTGHAAAHPDRPRRPGGAVAVSADGRRAVSGGDDGTVRVWDLDTGYAAAHPGRPRRPGEAVAVSARRPPRGLRRRRRDGAGVGPGHRGAAAHPDRPPRLGGAVAVSADGRRAVSGGDDGTVRVWDLATGKQVASASQRLWHWFARRLLRIWAPVRQRGRPPRRLRRPGRDGAGLGPGPGRAAAHPDRPRGWVRAVAVSADGRRAVSGSDGRDGAGVGPGHGRAAAHPDRPPRRGGARWRSAPTAAAPSPAARTGRCGCGTWSEGVALASFASDSRITALAATPPGTRVIAGTSTGPVHLLQLCGYE